MREAVSEERLTEIYNRNVNTVYKLCFTYLKNKADAEDAVQDTFIRCLERAPRFESLQHEKAWLIRVAANICKNMLKRASRCNASIEDIPEIEAVTDFQSRELVEEVLSLPEKYRDVIYLFYYEDYPSAEIAAMLKTTDATVRTRLRRGRALIKSVLLKEGGYGEE